MRYTQWSQQFCHQRQRSLRGVRLFLLCLAQLAFVVFFSVASQARGEELVDNAEHIRELATELQLQVGAPAVGLMYLKDGVPIISVSGLRVSNSNIAVAPNDKWHIGSNTKAITATLVARLVETGVIQWDDTVEDVLGEDIPELHQQYKKKTFLHLLTHRAGLPENLSIAEMFRLGGNDADGVPANSQRLALARRVLSRKSVTRKDNAFVYSNVGYIIAAAMLEKATGCSWENLVESEVFVPLRMHEAGFGAPSGIDIEGPSQPRGHKRGTFGGLRPVMPGLMADNPSAFGPAGRIHLSLQDYANFLKAHISGASGDESYLSSGSWATLHTAPFGGGYGLGWGISEGLLMHAGSNRYWYVLTILDLKNREAFVLVFNDARARKFQDELLSAGRSLLERF